MSGEGDFMPTPTPPADEGRVREEYTIRMILDAPRSKIGTLRGYATTAIEQSCRRARDGVVVLAIYDSQDRMITSKMSGDVTEELQDRLEDALGIYPDEKEGELG
jgi:hypothetical protein